ncbi:hypothetical protein [Streptomyces sp. NBC_01803]|uniref:hypothetical protein n=1 Tax=Streptomyces sp. NBC_01803 TaxID=2975946 RepID=UPI002DDAF7F3|nr:hypothetical protein [Streptomyces sp. NBC_01803]WSA44956.1 hypothetical protein OIE51_12495 [Streptomyces sp. NBC_01803]
MNAATKVGAFGAGLVLTFGVAFGVGSAFGPIGSDPEPSRHGGHGDEADDGNDGDQETHGGHGSAGPDAGASSATSASYRGYSLVPAGEPLTSGEPADFRFRVLGPDGDPLTRYERAHGKDLHLIVVRRDLSEYQHLHPALDDDGTWSVPLTVDAAGEYRVFADFVPAGDPDGPLTLGVDVPAAGPYEPEPLPAPERAATVDGYTVTLDGDLAAGAESELTLSVSRNGRPVTDLEPYLGAYGHLVALRADDLAYLHVHPEGAPGDGETPAGPGITFHAQAPSVGAYRLYLDFQHNGTVRTAEFTVEAVEAVETTETAETAESAEGGNADGHVH